ncbi:hypothetical protein [Saccharospirillum salsuginis]|uniref:Uncharacterized protein n=1 Tax=Saccharospirillum salsuginis TaxID=418750 RepID=A0A918KP93_9GAMM|nr:hypothetical protein [Saccharospirillum salsuginis]GGX68260.1 hypothetical protein GCM10007392_39780 [Saccharospirillum salsuginis]
MLYTFLRDTVRFFGNHWLPLVLITVGLGVLFEGATLVLMPAMAGMEFPWPIWLLQWVGGVWSSAAVILYLDRAIKKEYLPPRQAVLQALAWVPMLATVQFLTGIVVGLGLILIVPGLYFGVRLVLASFFLILDRQPVLDSMRTAWTRSVGYGWTIFGGYALIYGALILVSQVLFIGGDVEAGNTGYGLGTVLLNLLFKPVGALALVFGFRVYTDSQQST